MVLKKDKEQTGSINCITDYHKEKVLKIGDNMIVLAQVTYKGLGEEDDFVGYVCYDETDQESHVIDYSYIRID